jgi:hypothetical protein
MPLAACCQSKLMNVTPQVVIAFFSGPKKAWVSDPQNSRMTFSPAMPRPSAATNTASSAVAPALAAKGRYTLASISEPSTADSRMPNTADGQNGQSTRNTNVNAM